MFLILAEVHMPQKCPQHTTSECYCSAVQCWNWGEGGSSRFNSSTVCVPQFKQRNVGSGCHPQDVRNNGKRFVYTVPSLNINVNRLIVRFIKMEICSEIYQITHVTHTDECMSLESNTRNVLNEHHQILIRTQIRNFA